MSVQVSVVVPTYDRPDLLGKCLEALLAQDFEPDAYEIVVVDNAGTDATRQLVDSLSAKNGADASIEAGVRPRVYYLEETARRGPAAARNAGWRSAHGEFVAFTDDDCLPDRRWLNEGVRQLREGYDAVIGRVIVPIEGVPSDYERTISQLETAEFITANCFIRCSALQAAGGFDEEFTTAWREDSDLHFRLLALGREIGRAPRAKVVHPVRAAPWNISLKEQRKSMFNALLFKKHPKLYRERIQGAPPWLYYATLAAAGGLVIAVLKGRGETALVMGACWLGFTARFTAVRLRGTKRTLGHLAEMAVTSILIPPLSVFWRLYGAVKYRVWFL